MRHLLSVCLLPIFFTALNAQKEDHVWLLGGNFNSSDSVYKACRLDFSSDTFSMTYVNKGLPYDGINVSICDSDGKLSCFSNGKSLYNRDYEIMDGGSNFYPNANYQGGVSYIQGYILLPRPGTDSQVVHIYGNPKVVFPPSGPIIGYIKLRYAVADMSQNGGLGKVTERDVIAGTDTLMPTQMTAVRHGNSRDWWLLAPYYLGHKFYRYLLTPEGLQRIGEQNVQATDLGLGHTCFSPDGQWYARFNWHGIIPDSSFATFELYRFDRCSGLLSDRVAKTYDFSGLAGKPGGVAFSPSSRHLYVTRWDSVFQYDLQAPNITASEVVVAVYDYFAGDLGLPTRFFYPQLAPDNKIYICVSNYNSRYLHVIEHPDSAGMACQVRQHALRLPVFNNFLLPNLPYFRLGKWADSPCDTLGMVSAAPAPDGDEPFRLFPNPASSEIQIDFAEPLTSDLRLEVFNLTGQLLDTQNIRAGSSTCSLSIGSLPDGLYLLRIRENSRLIGQQKFSILH